MQELFPEVDVNEDQAEAIARGLFAVARADGDLHPREAALISEFFSSTSEHPADLNALEGSPAPTGEGLAQSLPTAELRTLFVKTAFLLAYADNELSDSEAKIIRGYAKALGVDNAGELEQQVKDFLLSQLSHLSNVQAAAEVARELKV